ncbi:MAG: hypothetical protein KatS3mg110_4327 [Pirellulaceae bacterium]|nr:MAG: hypothetical protein KatS3mg110_4327 [Pirellulaceae bacterium]
MSFSRLCTVLVGIAIFFASFPGWAQQPVRMYENILRPIENPQPILADFPQYVEPVREERHFEAPPLVLDASADLEVRAWRYSYHARGIVEIPNRLSGSKCALIVVHPWGIDDGQGWCSPEPAGTAFGCTPEKNRLIWQHAREVIRPLVERL